MTSELAASYAHCRAIARRSSSSFYYSFLLLPKRQRMAMFALYAFLRRTDDLGDSLADVAERREALVAWRRSLDRALDGQFDDPLLPALADAMQAFEIPRAYLDDVIDGIEMDLEPPGYRTFAELEVYCQRVASAVGLACLHIWGCTAARGARAGAAVGHRLSIDEHLARLERGCRARDRFYLPQEDLVRFDYTTADLRAGVRDERFRRLMQFEIERTEQLYSAAAELEGLLEPDAQRVFGSMVSVYRRCSTRSSGSTATYCRDACD